ncbi:elongation of very long chain fatty acids protein 4 [Angomonas deanei]|nr:elongation of very long chain fatty acids protein 4 [Angomonas deanei]|eukprot:EPY42946.1 elongation of very long chain fatty acids protein 4 [Angomonas deanei]
MTSFVDTIFPIETAEKWASVLEVPDALIDKCAQLTFQTLAPLLNTFEHVVHDAFPDFFDYSIKVLDSVKHPFADRLPFLSPYHVLFAVGTYFFLIAFFCYFGKTVGKGNYKLLGLLHNYGLHVLSLYMSVGLAVSARAAGYSLWNNAAGTSDKDYRVAKFVWVFYVSKVPEWFDTVLMLLKHNYHQVSVLHVYHHVTIFVIWWLACWMAPGGEAYYSAMVNSGVHVVMYFYYFVTMLFPSGGIRKFLNNFKFVITKGQMTQFAFNCLQSVYDLLWVPRSELKYSAGLLQLLFWYMISLLCLFGNFLLKGKSKARAQKGEGSQTKPHAKQEGYRPAEPLSQTPQFGGKKKQ